jgi:exopolysaccharide production repressor protein
MTTFGGKQAAPMMSLPLFLCGLLGTLLVVATSSYITTGSIWTTFSQTVICLVLAQIGYFATVLFQIWWLDRAKRRNATAKKRKA